MYLGILLYTDIILYVCFVIQRMRYTQNLTKYIVQNSILLIDLLFWGLFKLNHPNIVFVFWKDYTTTYDLIK